MLPNATRYAPNANALMNNAGCQNKPTNVGRISDKTKANGTKWRSDRERISLV